MDSIKNKVQSLNMEGYTFDLGKYLNIGNAITQKNLGEFIGFTALFFVIQMVMGFIPVIGSIGSAFLTPALTVGFYIVAKKSYNQELHEFGDFFKGINNLLPLFLVNIITGFAALFAFIPVIAYFVVQYSDEITQLIEISANPSSAEDFDVESLTSLPWAQIGIVTSLLMLLPILVTTLLGLAPLFVLFAQMTVKDALTASYQIVSKNLLSFFLFGIVIMFINIGGMLLFFVGLLYTIPLSMCAYYAAYEKIIGTTIEKGSEYDVTDHLVS